MGMVCCIAKVHDVQDDLKHDGVPREIQTDCISPQPEVDLGISYDLGDDTLTGQENISRQLTDCDLQDNERENAENEVSRKVEDDSNIDVAQEVDDEVNDDLKDELRKNDIRHPDGLKADEMTDDVPRMLEDDIKRYEVQDDMILQQLEDEIKDDQVQEIIPPQKLDSEILNSKDYGKEINLINLPTELLVIIIFYLPICDRMMMRHISQRFRNVAEIPQLWKKFTLYCQPFLKRHHMGIMGNLLKVIGEHVRIMCVYKVESTILKMLYNSDCRNVTHLILPSLVSSSWLSTIVYVMPRLQYLRMRPMIYTGGQLSCYSEDDGDNEYYTAVDEAIELLKGIPVTIKKLDLFLFHPTDLEPIVTGIQAVAHKQYCAIPSIINIFGRFNITATDNYDYDRGGYWKKPWPRPVLFCKRVELKRCTDNLFEFWSRSAFNLPPFKIRLYDTVPTTMNLFLPVPVRSYKFGAAVKAPTLIQLPAYGIVGLKENIFHFSEYIDDHGIVSHAVTLDHGDCGSLIEERHITCIPHLHTVSYVDISYENVSSNHLQQLAVACPNLQQLHLQGNGNCLNDLQGLQAIVDKCKNLKRLNLAEISVLSVESYLLLWELLSSLKKLTLLTIDLCMILLYDFDDDDEQKLVTMCKSCHSLLALNVHLGQESCIECNSINKKFLISHFPSLTYCALWNIEYSSVVHSFTNCHHLKCVHEYVSRGEEVSLFSLSKGIYRRDLQRKIYRRRNKFSCI